MPVLHPPWARVRQALGQRLTIGIPDVRADDHRALIDEQLRFGRALAACGPRDDDRAAGQIVIAIHWFPPSSCVGSRRSGQCLEAFGAGHELGLALIPTQPLRPLWNPTSIVTSRNCGCAGWTSAPGFASFVGVRAERIRQDGDKPRAADY